MNRIKETALHQNSFIRVATNYVTSQLTKPFYIYIFFCAK